MRRNFPRPKWLGAVKMKERQNNWRWTLLQFKQVKRFIIIVISRESLSGFEDFKKYYPRPLKNTRSGEIMRVLFLFLFFLYGLGGPLTRVFLLCLQNCFDWKVCHIGVAIIGRIDRVVNGVRFCKKMELRSGITQIWNQYKSCWHWFK